ncbi:hypothetical protein H5410_029684 [Solanum commersonii]|uniref:Uncharacterized protein n=1 Tax=Solanum commersonii TaxID=4109 RepID=A0A9J5YDL9_SOLCO|nr:hypothetical protein H5410_029684 [Solanum commersonii]
MRSEFGITKNSMDYNTRKLTKWGVYRLRGSFDLENGLFWPSEFRITKNSKDYSIRKSRKWGVYLLRGPFDHENRPFWPLGSTGTIGKILAKIMSEFWITKNSIDYSTRKSTKWEFTCSRDRLTLKHDHFGRLNGCPSIILENMRSEFRISKKNPWPILHEYRQNGGFTCSGDRLTLKMGRFRCESQLAP